MKQEVEKAVEVLRRGGVVLYPTDTVWGVGCDATNAGAVERVYALKRGVAAAAGSGAGAAAGSDAPTRPAKPAMTVLVASVDDVGRYVRRVPEVAWQLLELADKPLTLILPGGSGVAAGLLPESGTIGIRVPDHEFCRALLRRLGRPLVSTSANLSGEATPLTFGEISRAILDGVDMVVDRRFEGRPTGKPSSIIRLGEGGEIKIIRE